VDSAVTALGLNVRNDPKRSNMATEKTLLVGLADPGME
jgi:hypothetical protein